MSFSTRQTLLVSLGVIFAIYCLFQARFILLGPGIVIEEPKDGDVISSSTVMLVGRARNAAWLSLNGRQIYTDEEGRWSEKLILAQGLSIMTVRVRDRFARERVETLRLVHP